ncbi:two-component system CitB family response regulator [Saccharopolyspora lacisalsi]|uniref:Transcriptional regulatory protein n=1 Tax=Halosaccharopolyspora lacisalsi TaxID=1000566 RepID=A0A839DW67_9PSEU|nr:response regulator [Halosaccharopolyspora lacisalsi]MBA8823565.1 two-component system CitB family response regulator [Halosaccharopolyspora lacisalsi]
MIRVLVVDDDARVAHNHRKLVETLEGFEAVGVARTAAEALTSVEQLGPDLVLLDIYLPDESGVQVLQRLRGAAHTLDVLVITAMRDAETVQATMQSGAVHYLLKPFPFSELRDRLNQYAQARSALASVTEAEQSDVDRVYGLMRTRASPPAKLPKGLSQVTAQLVVDTLRTADTDLSALELGERAGLSRVSARRYLDHLSTTGTVELRLRYGSAGRPEHRYRWTGDADQ